jgi:hypothetical protein
MSVQYLAETTVDAIESLIKLEIGPALAALRTERKDAVVSTEPPASYFIYEKPHAYKKPAIITICRDIDFQKEKYGANQVTAKIKVVVSVVVEDKDRELLTIKGWRYQTALHSILDQKVILVPPNKAKLFIIITDASFSSIFSGETPQTTAGVFCQEMALTLEVQERESF